MENESEKKRAIKGHCMPGQTIAMAGYAGLEETLQLILEHQKEASSRFSEGFLKRIEGLDTVGFVKWEQELIQKFGITAVQAAGKGGVYHALWQLAEGSGVGMEVFLLQIPIRQEIIEIAEFFGKDPYQMDADGVCVMAVWRGEELIWRLREKGIPAAVIGSIQRGRKRVLKFHDRERFLVPYR